MAKKDKKNKVLHIKGTSVMRDQKGGDHYSKHSIQPIEIAYLYNMTPGATLALRYLLRYRDKGGAEDLQKLGHLIQMIEELEYNDGAVNLEALLKKFKDEEDENSATR